MAEEKFYIAVDLGAESGRVMISGVSGDKLSLEEIARFSNGPVEENGVLKWDFDKLMGNIKAGIAKATKNADGEIAGIGIDSWGVDYGLLDETGRLLEKPYHYRDPRTDGMLEKAFEIMGKRNIYDNTGIQFMQLNTAYQLLSARLSGSESLQNAKQLIFIADLVAYYLCGEAFAEYSLASTSQLMDMKTGQWSAEIFEKLELPLDIMPKVVQPGTVVGTLTAEVAAELGCGRIPLIASGSHDTAAAVAAVPSEGGKWAYLSSGTWSLMGIETPSAIINDKTFDKQLTNEGGVENTIRLLKNIMGLWLVQECRRHWLSDGVELSYAEITEMAEAARPFAAYVDTEYSDFFSPGQMPEKINKYLAETGQETTDDKGQIVRLVLESLAMRYREVIGWLEELCGSEIDVLHIVGGGIQNKLLCQFAANATGKKVIAGPVEATAAGNVIMQAIATGQLASLSEARKIVGNSFPTEIYLPQDVKQWYERYNQLAKGR